MQPGSVRVTIVVDVEPSVAFEIFTEETDAWFGIGTGAAKRGALRFDDVAQQVWSRRHAGVAEELVGPITVWDPPRRLVFTDRRDTEIDVRFEPHDAQTRVTLEHRGLDRLPPDDAQSVVQYGWRRMAFDFETYLVQRREGTSNEEGT